MTTLLRNIKNDLLARYNSNEDAISEIKSTNKLFDKRALDSALEYFNQMTALRLENEVIETLIEALAEKKSKFHESKFIDEVVEQVELDLRMIAISIEDDKRIKFRKIRIGVYKVLIKTIAKETTGNVFAAYLSKILN